MATVIMFSVWNSVTLFHTVFLLNMGTQLANGKIINYEILKGVVALRIA